MNRNVYELIEPIYHKYIKEHIKKTININKVWHTKDN